MGQTPEPIAEEANEKQEAWRNFKCFTIKIKHADPLCHFIIKETRFRTLSKQLVSNSENDEGFFVSKVALESNFKYGLPLDDHAVIDLTSISDRLTMHSTGSIKESGPTQ